MLHPTLSWNLFRVVKVSVVIMLWLLITVTHGFAWFDNIPIDHFIPVQTIILKGKNYLRTTLAKKCIVFLKILRQSIPPYLYRYFPLSIHVPTTWLPYYLYLTNNKQIISMLYLPVNPDWGFLWTNWKCLKLLMTFSIAPTFNFLNLCAGKN